MDFGILRRQSRGALADRGAFDEMPRGAKQVSEVRTSGRVIWFEHQHLPVGFDGLFDPSQCAERLRHVEMSAGEIGFDRDGFPERENSLCHPALCIEDRSEIIPEDRRWPAAAE